MEILKCKKLSLALIVLCLVLGLIIGIQLRTINAQTEKNTANMIHANEMASKVKKLTDENIQFKQVIMELETKISSYQNTLSESNETYNHLMEEVTKLKNFAGLTELNGRGVVVTLNDSKLANDPLKKIDVNTFLIHDEDILSVINELSAAGAEAISVNNQRIVGTSSVRCVGPVVSINDVKIGAPYVISAIGDPDALQSGLELPGGVMDSLAPWGIEIDIEKSNNVTVVKYVAVTPFKEAVQTVQ